MINYWKRFSSQLRGLNRKNLIELKTLLLSTICLIFVPLVVNCGYSVYTESYSGKSAPGVSISKLNRCVPVDFNGNQITPTSEKDDCYTLIYAPTSERNDAIMKMLAEMNGLTFGEDVIGFENEANYLSHIYTPYDSDYRFATAGVYFDEDELNRLQYHIWTNTTYQSAYYGTSLDREAEYQYLTNVVQLAVENAINKYTEPSISPIELVLKENPLLDKNEFSLVSAMPTYWLTLGTGLVFMIYFYMYFLRERQSSMLDYLRGLGIYESVLFHSQFIRFFVVSLFSGIFWEISGRLVGGIFFSIQPIGLPTVFMTFYLLGMCYLGQILSSFIRRLWRFIMMVVFLVLCAYFPYYISHLITGSYVNPFSLLGVFFQLPNPMVLLDNYMCCLAAMNYVFDTITWKSLFEETIHGLIPIKVLFPNILFGFIMQFLLFWYFSYKNAYHLKCCFFFNSTFWSAKPIKSIIGQPTHDSARDEKNSRDHNSIVFSYVTKVFQTCTAVNELHFEITPNQIYTLLGPNGCGKTTTVSMLTGVFPPTYGTIYVSGQDMEDNREMMRDRCGVCSQFDHFWTGFSCSDMFDVIGRLKGFSNSEIESEKKRLLDLFNLSSVRDKNVDTFSGGMKRKLTVALACMKGFDILVLDEPTSGMDVISRAELWNVLTELKKDHTILLTTHSMEEADVISDTVGIMFMGRLRAVGTPSGMKKHYGKGYKVDVLLEEGTNSDEILSIMNKYMVNSEKISESLTKVSIGIGKEDMKFLPRFLNDVKNCRCTKEWLISPSTMDEVFIKVVESNSNVEVADEINKREEERENRVQIRLCAICGRNPAEQITLYSKKGKPYIIDGLFCRSCIAESDSESEHEGESNELIKDQTEEDVDDPTVELLKQSPPLVEEHQVVQEKVVDSTPLPEMKIRDVENVSFCRYAMALTWLNFKLITKNKGGMITTGVLLAIWILVVLIVGVFSFSFSTQCPDGSISYPICINNSQPISWDPSSDESFVSGDNVHFYMKTHDFLLNTSFIIDDSQSGLKANSIRWVDSLDFKPYADSFIFFNSTDIDADIIQKQKYIISNVNTTYGAYVIQGTKQEAYNALIQLIPQFSLKMTGSGNVLQAELGMYPQSATSIRVLNEPSYWEVVSSANLMEDRVYPATATLSLSYLHTFSNSSLVYLPRITNIRSKVWTLPTSSTIQNCISFIPIFYLATSFLLIYRVVNDRSKNSLSLLYINGVQSYHYVTSLFMSFTLFLLFFMIIFLLIFASFQSYLVKLIPFTVITLLWGCIHCAAFFLVISCIFSSATFAVVLNVVINCIAALPFYYDYDHPMILTALPGSSLMLFARYMVKPSVTKRALCIQGLMISFIFTIIYVALSYLIMWISQDLSLILDRYYQKKRGSGSYVNKEDGVQLEEEGVIKEAQFVEANFKEMMPGNHHRLSLIVKGVSKYFFKGGVKRVFPEVSFSIKDNEIFGLLGPNGAGKTTLINILTCKLNPNFGEMKVFGYDYSHSRKVKQLISVVPQFDVFFDDMTVEEHLTLVAKLHCVDRKLLDQTCREKAEAVGLSHNAYRQNSGNLSGGQKRRLTLGMALMSQPHLLFLDEPTTGLDPETRFAIWDTIKKIQESMTILITTHSMEEADALCSRIAIMTKHGLQCIGDQIHLKNKFGKGFLLSVSLDPSIPDIKGYVKANICPMAEYLETRVNIHTFTILKDKVDLSNLILKVMKLSKEGVVTYWSVNESSLGDVFERICKDDER